jgi:hypothetical protein
MRHFYRSHIALTDVLADADQFFPALGLTQSASTPKSRTYSGPLGALKVSVKAEGGHYTFVEVNTDQMGESRLDRNVKRFFVGLHRTEDPAHELTSNY